MRLLSGIKLQINVNYINIVFYCSWVLYSVVYTMLSSEYTALINLVKINKLTQYVVILALASCFFVPKAIVKNRVWRVVIMILSVAATLLHNPNKNFLIIFLFIATARYINLEHFMKMDLILKLSLFIFIVISCGLGIINNYTTVINGSRKMSFGFGHPNVFCFYLFVIILEYMYVRYEKIKLKQIFVILLLWVGAYLIGAARTSCISFLLAFLLYILAKKKETFVCSKPMTLIYILGFAGIAAFSFISVYYYIDGSPLMYEMNELLTGRLYMASEFLKLYEINLLGNDVITLGARDAAKTNQLPMILDNSYIRCVLFYGVVFSSILAFLFIKKFVYYAKKIKPQWLCIAVFFIISGFAESYLINIFYNVTLLFLLKNDDFNVLDRLNQWLKRNNIKIKV